MFKEKYDFGVIFEGGVAKKNGFFMLVFWACDPEVGLVAAAAGRGKMDL